MLMRLLLCLLLSAPSLAQVDDLKLEDLDDLLLIDQELDPEFEEQADDIGETDAPEESEDEEIVLEQEKQQENTEVEELLTEIEEETVPAVEELDQEAIEKITTRPTQNIEAVDFSVVDELSEARKKNILNLVEQKKRKAALTQRYRNTNVEALQVQLSDISKSPLRLVYLPRGSRLIRLSDDKTFKLVAGIYAKAHVKEDFSKRRYLINERDELAYSVGINELTDISKMTDLYRRPRRFQRLQQRVKPKEFNEQFDYSLNFNLHLALNYPEYTKKLIGDPSWFAPNLRVEGAWVSQLDFGFKAGFSSMYESLSGELVDGGAYSTQSLSVGPVFKSQRFWENYRLVLQGRLSLLSRISIARPNNTTNYNLSENVLLIGLEEAEDYKKLGKFIFGYSIQRKWLRTAAAGTIGSETNARTRYDDSFGIYIGHQSDWIW